MKPFHINHRKASLKIPNINSHYLKLRSRFSLYFFLLILLPCMIVSIVTYFHVRSLVEDKAYIAALASISQEKTAIEKYIGDLKLAVSAASDALIHAEDSIGAASITGSAGVSSDIVDSLPLLLENAVDTSLSPGQKKAFSAVYVLSGSKIIASYGFSARKVVINSPSTQQWYFDVVNNPDVVYLPGTMQRFYDEGKSMTVFCMAKSLTGKLGEMDPVVLLFDFDYSVITDFTSTSTSTDPAITERLILDFSGNVLYSQDHGKLTASAEAEVLEAIGNVGQGFKRILYNNRSCYISYIRYPDLNWIFIDLNPVSNVMDHLWLRSPFMIACMIALPILLLIYLTVSLRLLNPINELTAVISDYENQLPDTGGQYSLIHKSDLSGNGVNGISDIDFLINKVYNIKLKQKEAELNSLQNQINPHFLYNTLESIRGAALYHGIHDIAAMSKALSLFFRYSIGEKVLVSIKDEIHHLDNYMSIQNFRYENKFELLYSIPQELMNYKILKLTLQPLVENSIKHGLEMKLGRGTVKIEMLSLGSNIKIQITDDGLGMSPKKVDELNRSLNEVRAADETSGADDSSMYYSIPGYEAEAEQGSTPSPTSGIGIKNVNSRIKLYFGKQYGLKFKDAIVGTTVEITLPAIMDN